MERNSLTNCVDRGAISMTRLLALAYDMSSSIRVQALAQLVRRYVRLVYAPAGGKHSASPCRYAVLHPARAPAAGLRLVPAHHREGVEV